MEDHLRRTGNGLIGDVPWGTHFCQFYRTKEDLLDILVPYFRAGLEDNEFCMWITSEPLSTAEAQAAMRRAMPDFDRRLKNGQIEILRYTEWYVRDGAFESQKVLQGWVEKVNKALERGFAGLRLSGNTFWLEKKDWRKFTDYEEEVDSVIGKYRMMALCTYSLDKCGATEIIDVIRNHEFALIKREGQWEIIEGSERKKAGQQYAAIIRTAMDGFWITDAEGRFLDVNEAYSNLVGYSRDELLRMRISDVEAQEAAEDTERHIEKIRNMGSDRFETRHRCKDGRIVDLEVSVNFQPQEDGRLFVFLRDVTRRKQAEEALRAARVEAENEKRRLEAVMESLPVGVAITDRRGGNIRSNSAFERVWRGPRPGAHSVSDYAAYKAWWAETGKPVAPDEWASALALNGGEPVEGQLMEIERFDGNRAFVLNSASPVRDSDGRIIGSAVAIQEITALRETEQALRKSEARFRLLSETAARLLATDDPQGIVNDLCRDVMAHLDCQTFFNFLADKRVGRLRLNAYAGIPEEEAREIEWLDYGVAVCGCAARDSRRIVAEDILHVPDPRTELVKSYGVQAYACHPLFSHGEVIGTLSFGTRNRPRFTEDELALMKTVADQVAVAMERIRHIQELEAVQKELRASHDQLETRVRERTDELVRVNEELRTEISSRKKAEKAVVEQARMLEAFFTSSITPLVFLDRQFNFIRVNAAYAQACGKTVADFAGRNHFEFYPHKENEAIFREVVETKGPYQALAKPFVFPDHPEWGTTYWDWTVAPLLNERGEVEFLVFALKDVTERKEAEEKIAEQAALLGLAHDAILVRDMNDRIAFWNRGAEETYGWTEEEALGRPIHDVLKTELPEPLDEIQVQLLAKGRWEGELRHNNRQGDVLIVESRWALQRDESGGPKGILEINRNITPRKKAQEALRRAHDELEIRVEERTAQLAAANRELESFSYSVAHDLRAPLRAIDGFSRMFLEDYGRGLDAEGHRLLGVIRSNATKMGQLIDDLLTFSRLSRQEIKMAEIDTQQLAESVFAEVRGDGSDRQIQFRPGTLLTVKGDPAMLRQVFGNLLSNAIKFTRPRETAVIEVNSRREGREIVFSIKDNGVGFDQKYASKLFGVFQRLHGSEEFEGTGVGLALVDRIIHRHGGRVWAEGRVGEGATFYFSLPKE